MSHEGRAFAGQRYWDVYTLITWSDELIFAFLLPGFT